MARSSSNFAYELTYMDGESKSQRTGRCIHYVFRQRYLAQHFIVEEFAVRCTYESRQPNLGFMVDTRTSYKQVLAN